MRSAAGCAALGVGLLLVAGTFDAEPLYVTGAALVLLGAGAATWIMAGAWGASVHRQVAARSVMEDEKLRVRVEVRAGRFPLPPGFIDEPLLPDPAPLRAGRRTSVLRIDVSFARRGRRRLAPVAVVMRDPLGLAERVVSSGAEDEVLVLPRIEAVRLSRSGGDDSGLSRARALLTTTAEAEIDGLRAHEDGSPASRIHWASVAKGGDIMERRLTAEADSRPLVVLDPRGGRAPEDLDAAVRAAGSLVVHFARRTGCALLLPGDRRAVTIEPDLFGWPSAHVRLALLEDAAGPALAAAQNRRGLILFVSARRVDRPPRGLGRTPGGHVLIVPGAVGDRSPVLTVAGCSGYLGARAGSGRALEALSG